MEAAKQDLMLNIKTVRSAKDFEDLHNRIARIVGHISDIGELYVYDTTTRIGAFLGLYPESVYLHSGTRAGAALLGLSIQREHIPPEEMPEEMRTLKIYEMEDVLCHCTHLLAKTERVQKTPDC